MKVGFIGLGNVGGKLSGSLLRNGIDVTVHDLNADLVAEFAHMGAGTCEGPADLMRKCDFVITCLPSPAASDAVMQEMLPEVGAGNRAVNGSTTAFNHHRTEAFDLGLWSTSPSRLFRRQLPATSPA